MEKSIPATPVFTLYYIAIDTEAGITPERFEAFVQQKGAAIPCYPGWRWTLLRGLRGERAGQFLMLFEIESAEQRDRYLTPEGNPSELAQQFWQQHPEAQSVVAEWRTFGTFSELPTIYTDFVLLAENARSTVPDGPRYQNISGQAPVQRVIGLHNVALRAGISADRFESFIADNHHRIEDYPDWKFRLLKGVRGNRRDQYMVLMEITDQQALNFFYPEPDIATGEAAKFARAHRDTKVMYEEWKKLASFSGSPQLYTDYLSVAESGQ